MRADHSVVLNVRYSSPTHKIGNNLQPHGMHPRLRETCLRLERSMYRLPCSSIPNLFPPEIARKPLSSFVTFQFLTRPAKKMDLTV